MGCWLYSDLPDRGAVAAGSQANSLGDANADLVYLPVNRLSHSILGHRTFATRDLFAPNTSAVGDNFESVGRRLL